MLSSIYVLGVETSCDETAIALLRYDPLSWGRGNVHGYSHASCLRDIQNELAGTCDIVGHIVLSQIEEHAVFGGVVPEIAARSHLAHLPALLERVMCASHLALSDIDVIGVTCGPGLIGSVMVGTSFCKGLSMSLGRPVIGVNHLEAHILTPRFTHRVAFPYLALLLSGGHAQIILVSAVGRYACLGETQDDALGEAFDKVAKMLGLPYPGGFQVEALAASGDAARFSFSPPMKRHKSCDFSFSGLKTAVRQAVENMMGKQEALSSQDKADICVAFQQAALESILSRLSYALEQTCCGGVFPEKPRAVVFSGGVASNKYFRQHITQAAAKYDLPCFIPPPFLCTDNGVMVAYATLERFLLEYPGVSVLQPRARWPLTEVG